ncbi:MAG: bile acid:sodium symporter family protein [Peptostreptococcaceae bacterium]
MRVLNKISNVVSKNMTILIVLIGVYSFFIPTTFAWVQPKMSNILSIMMFGVGMTISIEQFKFVLERPKDIFIGAIGQYTIMPLVAYTLSRTLNLSPELTLGLILVGCCPGGISSNIMTFISKGDVALSVSLTTVSTLLAPIATPIITLLLANSQIEISINSMFISIIKTVIVPIILAIICNKVLPKVSEIMVKVLPLLSSILLMLLVSGSISASIDSIKTSGLLVLIAVMIHHTIGLGLGYFLGYKCGFTEEKRRAVCLEVGMQNSGLAITLGFAHFSPVVAMVGALSGPFQTVISAILGNYWSSKGSGKKKIVELANQN